MSNGEWPELRREAAQIWERNAAFWTDAVLHGNGFQRLLLGPATERLLAIHPGERVLDVGCGHGVFSRRLAELGACVVAIDGSPTFIERAEALSREQADSIEYRVVDATDEDALSAIGERAFDAVVATMVFMDLPVLHPLLSAIATMIKVEGRVVFSVAHPFAAAPRARKMVEEEDVNGTLVTRQSVQVSEYARPSADKNLGIVGQPVPHYLFHRPLGVLLGACFAAGFVVDGLEEPTFSGDPEGDDSPFSWSRYREIPPVLVVRLKHHLVEHCNRS